MYLELKQYDEAIKYLKEAIKLQPEALHPRTELGRVYLELKQYDEAKAVFEECLEIDTKDLNSRLELGKLYKQSGDYKKAEKFFLECIDIKNDDLCSRLELSKLCSTFFNNQKMAMKYLEEIIMIEPSNMYANTELAILYQKAREYRKCDDIRFNLYKSLPDDIPNLTGLSKTFSLFRKYRVAIKLLEKALHIKKNDLLTMLEIIRLYDIFHDLENVEYYLRRGKAVITKNPNVKFRDRFEKINLSDKNCPKLIELMNVGIYRHNNDDYIESEGRMYRLVENPVINNRLKNRAKVYFGTYMTVEGVVLADFVEPYFENIIDLKSLK